MEDLRFVALRVQEVRAFLEGEGGSAEDADQAALARGLSLR